jgi:AcrR family transcriptional regulator
VIDAALRCICRWGVAKTALDDVAREAGCSRATVYRLFPGGKDGLMEAIALTEIDRFFTGVGTRLAEATTLEDALTAGIAEAGRRILGHKALQYLLEHEPEAVLPRLAFSEMDQVLRTASEFAAPHLNRFIADADTAVRAAEWVARLVVSYAITPAEGVSIEDEGSVRALVQTFVMPGLQSTTTQSNTEGGSTNG